MLRCMIVDCQSIKTAFVAVYGFDGEAALLWILDPTMTKPQDHSISDPSLHPTTSLLQHSRQCLKDQNLGGGFGLHVEENR